MNYTIHSGVLLEEICGEFLLLATAEALGKVPYALNLNRTQAYFFSLLEEGQSDEEITARAAEAYHITTDQVAPVLQNFLTSLTEMGYLTPRDSAK